MFHLLELGLLLHVRIRKQKLCRSCSFPFFLTNSGNKRCHRLLRLLAYWQYNILFLLCLLLLTVAYTLHCSPAWGLELSGVATSSSCSIPARPLGPGPTLGPGTMPDSSTAPGPKAGWSLNRWKKVLKFGHAFSATSMSISASSWVYSLPVSPYFSSWHTSTSLSSWLCQTCC